MNDLVKFNPQSQTYVSKNGNGTFAPKVVTRQEKAGPQILSQHPKTANEAAKILR